MYGGRHQDFFQPAGFASLIPNLRTWIFYCMLGFCFASICSSPFKWQQSTGEFFRCAFAFFGQLRLAILAILRLHPCGVIILAPVCSGFSFMCSSQAQRYWFQPEGNTELSWVRAGNIMANRVTLLAWLATALGHAFFVEQPASKKFGDMPRWRYFAENITYATWKQCCHFHILEGYISFIGFNRNVFHLCVRFEATFL